MKNLGLFTILCISVFMPRWAVAGTLIEAQLHRLEIKAKQCIVQMKENQIGGPTSFCDDFREYQEYLFKGDAKSWVNYHMDNNDLNQHNQAYFFRVMRSTNDALKAIVGHRTN